jgi:Leucine-rich repeat (LRR) protein
LNLSIPFVSKSYQDCLPTNKQFIKNLQILTYKLRVKTLKSNFDMNKMKTIISLLCILFLGNSYAQNNQPGTYFSLDSAFKNPTDVRILNLRYAGLRTLPPTISKFQNLQIVYLAGNDMITLPPEIGQLKQLTEIHLEDNFIRSLPKEIAQLENLRVLIMPYNDLDSFPTAICPLKNLTKVNMRGSKIPQKSQDSIKQVMPNCHFSFNENELLESNQPLLTAEELRQAKVFNDVETARQTIADVFIIRLSKKKLTQWPNEVFEFKNLQALDISENKISIIPAEISELYMLQSLNLRSNNLSDLPQEISKLHYLKSLKIGLNHFSTVPAVVWTLQPLEDLDLSFNRTLTEIKGGIGQLTELKSLNLYSCAILKIAPEIGKLIKLEELNLYGNNITTLPPEIAQCKNLQIINLSANSKLDYKQVLDLLSNCKQLKSIDLRDTNIPVVKRNKIKLDFPETELIF